MSKPILCLDFDGVCHSYTSGWKGADVIPDPPVDGMWPFLEAAIRKFEVHIYSARNNQPGGIDAMKKWFVDYANSGYERDVATKFLSFPTKKPPAFVTIDDRVICFTGKWPTIREIDEFRPWNKQ